MYRSLPDYRNGGMTYVADPEFASEQQKSRALQKQNKGLRSRFKRKSQMADELLESAKSWKTYGQFQKETLDAVIELAKKEHATSEAYRHTAHRLWEESAKAPRPEERPFARDVTEMRKYQENVFKETLMNDTTVSAKVKKIKDNIRPKYEA